MGVHNRTALVTGATSGLGEDIAIELAAAGAYIGVAGRDVERGAAVVERIRAAGGRAEFFEYEAVDISSTVDLAAAALEVLGGVDILVNNAGTMFFGPLAAHTPEAFDRAVAINLRSPFLLTQALVPAMAERRYGRVVFISSNGASSGAAMTTLYAMTKAGIEGFMRALMAEFAPFGVTFNTVEPGLIDTPLTSTMLSDPEKRAHFAKHHPNQRVGEAQDITHAVSMLVDDRAGHMQSMVLVVDGGLTRAIAYAVIEPPEDKKQ